VHVCIILVFFGDSITAGWGGAGSSIWNEKYAPIQSSNFGIGGHITTQTIARIVDEGVLNDLNAKVAVVKIGTNDLSRNTPEAEIAANIRIIVDEILARQPHCRVLLLGILPRSK
jgi:lysophospholipase L1-like esterase